MSALKFAVHHHYDIVCRDAAGKVKWTDEIDNITVNVGLDEMLDKFWKGAAYSASHFVGLTAGTPTIAAADTMAAHAGWTESVVYSNATRPALTLGAVAAQSVDNTAAKATFNINAAGTIGGSFITTNNTKSGTTGILMGGAAFTGGNRVVANLDTVEITATLTAASA